MAKKNAAATSLNTLSKVPQRGAATAPGTMVGSVLYDETPEAERLESRKFATWRGKVELASEGPRVEQNANVTSEDIRRAGTAPPQESPRLLPDYNVSGQFQWEDDRSNNNVQAKRPAAPPRKRKKSKPGKHFGERHGYAPAAPIAYEWTHKAHAASSDTFTTPHGNFASDGACELQLQQGGSSSNACPPTAKKAPQSSTHGPEQHASPFAVLSKPAEINSEPSAADAPTVLDFAKIIPQTTTSAGLNDMNSANTRDASREAPPGATASCTSLPSQGPFVAAPNTRALFSFAHFGSIPPDPTSLRTFASTGRPFFGETSFSTMFPSLGGGPIAPPSGTNLPKPSPFGQHSGRCFSFGAPSLPSVLPGANAVSPAHIQPSAPNSTSTHARSSDFFGAATTIEPSKVVIPASDPANGRGGDDITEATASAAPTIPVAVTAPHSQFPGYLPAKKAEWSSHYWGRHIVRHLLASSAETTTLSTRSLSRTGLPAEGATLTATPHSITVHTALLCHFGARFLGMIDTAAHINSDEGPAECSAESSEMHVGKVSGQEKSKNDSPIGKPGILLVDASPHVLEMLISWIYTGAATITKSSASKPSTVNPTGTLSRPTASTGYMEDSSSELDNRFNNLSASPGKSGASPAHKTRKIQQPDKVHNRSDDDGSVYTALIDLYIFASTYDLLALRRWSLWKMVHIMNSNSTSAGRSGTELEIPTTVNVTYAFQSLPLTSPLREWLIEIYINHYRPFSSDPSGSTPVIKYELKHWSGLPPEFLAAVIVGKSNLLVAAEERAKSLYGARAVLVDGACRCCHDPCSFHEHEGDVEKKASCGGAGGDKLRKEIAKAAFGAEW